MAIGHVKVFISLTIFSMLKFGCQFANVKYYNGVFSYPPASDRNLDTNIIFAPTSGIYFFISFTRFYVDY